MPRNGPCNECFLSGERKSLNELRNRFLNVEESRWLSCCKSGGLDTPSSRKVQSSELTTQTVTAEKFMKELEGRLKAC